jgi:WD40 repeat protein
VHILGGHKGAVIDVTVHPSGKLALSISKDNTLKLWNLVQGEYNNESLLSFVDVDKWNLQ